MFPRILEHLGWRTESVPSQETMRKVIMEDCMSVERLGIDILLLDMKMSYFLSFSSSSFRVVAVDSGVGPGKTKKEDGRAAEVGKLRVGGKSRARVMSCWYRRKIALQVVGLGVWNVNEEDTRAMRMGEPHGGDMLSAR